MRYRVARASDLPEQVGWCVEVEGRELALFRQGERVFALDNVCPHRGAALAWGEVRAGVVYCPLHAWPFEVETGRCPEFPGVAVDAYPVTIEGGDVFVEL
ncbi:MAG: nitrite reductase (NAD(P)H) small subunit [Anaeromyxobacteraceae bacterium]